MAGMFDNLMNVAGKMGSREEKPEMLKGVSPEQRAAAAARLKAKGMPLTAVNIAEEVAMGEGEAKPEAAKEAAPMAQGRPVMGGPQPSPEMLQAVKAQQDARNRAVLERAMAERKAMSGAR